MYLSNSALDAYISRYDNCRSYESLLMAVRSDLSTCENPRERAVLQLFYSYLKSDNLSQYPEGIENVAMGPGIDPAALSQWMRSTKSRLNNG